MFKFASVAALSLTFAAVTWAGSPVSQGPVKPEIVTVQPKPKPPVVIVPVKPKPPVKPEIVTLKPDPSYPNLFMVNFKK